MGFDHTKIGVALLVLLIPSVCFCQSPAYLDSDSPSKAVGQIKASLAQAQLMRRECIGYFPALQQEIDANFSKWKNDDSVELKKAEHYWSLLEKQDTNISQYLAVAENAQKSAIETPLKMPNNSGMSVLSMACRKHFSNLAAGVWRVRTPNTYKFMAQLP